MRRDWVSRELTIEVMVGAFVVMIFIGLAYFTIILSKETWFGTKHIREIRFEEVMGLREGDSVVVRGMPVGKVRELDLGEDHVRVIVALVLDVVLLQKAVPLLASFVIIENQPVAAGKKVAVGQVPGFTQSEGVLKGT